MDERNFNPWPPLLLFSPSPLLRRRWSGGLAVGGHEIGDGLHEGGGHLLAFGIRREGERRAKRDFERRKPGETLPPRPGGVGSDAGDRDDRYIALLHQQ